MLHEVMAYYGFRRDLRHVGYFETAQHQQIVAALKAAITQGQLIALSGIVGCGKTTTLYRLHEVLGASPTSWSRNPWRWIKTGCTLAR